MNKFKIGDKVKVSQGRNNGKIGQITHVKTDAVYVNFGGNVYTWDHDTYPDSYWIGYDYIAQV